VIDRKAIDTSGAANVDDLLKHVTGVDVVRATGATSSTANVTLRGFGGQARGRTLVLVDGVPVNDHYSGEVYWNTIPVKSVERVEIVHGAASALYGPGAMGGVINIVTRKPRKLENEIDLTYGSLHSMAGHISHGNKIGPLSYLLSGDGFKTDGYVAAVNPMTYDIKRTKENYSADLKLTYDMSDAASIGLGYRHYQEDVNGGRQYYYGANRVNDLRFNVCHQADLFDLRGNVYFNGDDSSWTYDRYTVAPATRYKAIDYITKSPKSDWGGNLQSVLRLPKSQTLVLGTDWRLGKIESRDDYLSSARKVSVQGKQDMLGVFLQYEARPFEPLNINLAGRYDFWRGTDGSLYDSSLATQSTRYGDRSENAFSPQASLLYHPVKEATLRLSAGKSFRTPTLYDLYRTWASSTTLYRSNADLSPEDAWSYEFGMDYHLMRKLTARLAFYYSDVRNLIYSLDTGTKSGGLSVKQKQNVGKVEIQGVEAELRYSLFDAWSVYGGYTYNSSKIREHPDKTIERNYLTYAPLNKYFFGISFRDPKIINVDIAARHIGTFYNDDKNSQVLGNDLIWDLGITLPIYKGLEGSLKAENIFNRDYQAYWGTLAPPLTIMGTIKWSF
jgi:iron complex outermembrane receptor protein